MEAWALIPIFALSIPIIAIITNALVKVAESRSSALAQAERTPTGEEALFGIAAAEDLRDLKQRMDRLESQIAAIANAVQGSTPAPTRSLDPQPVQPPSFEPPHLRIEQ